MIDRMLKVTVLLFCGLMFLSHSQAQAQAQFTQVNVMAGDTQALITAINEANARGDYTTITIIPSMDGADDFVFTGPAEGFDSVLPPISAPIIIKVDGSILGRVGLKAGPSVTHEFRLTTIPGDSDSNGLEIDGFFIEGFGTNGSGGAILVDGGGFLDVKNTTFKNNSAGGNGGAVASMGNSHLEFHVVRFLDNQAANTGGSLSIEGMSKAEVNYSSFNTNSAGVFGCDININSSNSGSSLGELLLLGNTFTSECNNVLLENPIGRIRSFNNSFSHPGNAIDSTDLVRMFGSLFNLANANSTTLSVSEKTPKTQAMCNDFGSGAFQSDGFNISPDGSCALDQDTDLPSTDPMITLNEEGLPVPQPGSPAIDSGTFGLILVDGGPLASLPCGYRDVAGTARPQDASGDGMFECDRGAMEVMGAGEIVAGHSSVFYNPARNGEGNYVEILENGQAIVYTFSYNPEGTGPAWFLGLGEVNGNSIVLDDLLRPTGTPFGDGFDATEIDFTEAGSMSMVFPDCEASAPGGNVAFTGDVDLGYEALITRSTRLAHIAGCGAETPVPNAGLSGSFFDPARNGEGLIVEWLTNGDVLVVFFTYDTEGNQLWLFGQAPSNGKSVTLTALYPTSFTPWGRSYNADDVAFDSWGTFTLTWTNCNSMTFEYNSTVAGFGAGTRNYTRLSTLSGVTCPAFP